MRNDHNQQHSARKLSLQPYHGWKEEQLLVAARADSRLLARGEVLVQISTESAFAQGKLGGDLEMECGQVQVLVGQGHLEKVYPAGWHWISSRPLQKSFASQWAALSWVAC